jgi:hypothetical protein
MGANASSRIKILKGDTKNDVVDLNLSAAFASFYICRRCPKASAVKGLKDLEFLEHDTFNFVPYNDIGAECQKAMQQLHNSSLRDGDLEMSGCEAYVFTADCCRRHRSRLKETCHGQSVFMLCARLSAYNLDSFAVDKLAEEDNKHAKLTEQCLNVSIDGGMVRATRHVRFVAKRSGYLSSLVSGRGGPRFEVAAVTLETAQCTYVITSTNAIVMHHKEGKRVQLDALEKKDWEEVSGALNDNSVRKALDLINHKFHEAGGEERPTDSDAALVVILTDGSSQTAALEDLSEKTQKKLSKALRKRATETRRSQWLTGAKGALLKHASEVSLAVATRNGLQVIEWERGGLSESSPSKHHV